MTEPSKAVFLSYASQDTAAAHRMSEALRAGGVEVWLDTTELRGGDAWDQKIQRQIKDCALFIPVISATTQARDEGYFRLEWKLAVERTRLLSDDRSFLVPVVIDDIAEGAARVPDVFRHVQWTRLPSGEAPPAFVDRIRGLLGSTGTRFEPNRPISAPSAAPAPLSPLPVVSKTPGKLSPALLTAIAVAVLAIGYGSWQQFKSSQPAAVSPTVTAASPAASAAVPVVTEQSVAVLPFADMSEKKDQEYFSDGLSEELIDLLSKVPDLHVAARTSTFYFKGKNEKLTTIAKELNVTHVLEGSVRKAGNRLRVTAQLIRADNGFHLWSETYDRDAKDIFKVQDEISTAVVAALKLRLAAAPMAAGNRATSNAEAYNQFLIGRHFLRNYTLDGYRRGIDAFEKALALDPNYAAARLAASYARANIADLTGDSAGLRQAIADLDQAVALAPDQSDSYRYQGIVRTLWQWDWAGAKASYEKAIALDPTEPYDYMDYGSLLGNKGQFKAAIDVTQKTIALDPLATDAMNNIEEYQIALRDWSGAEATLTRALQIAPGNAGLLGVGTDPGMAALRLLQGRAVEALSFCQQISDERDHLPCLAQAEYSVGHRAEADQALADLLQKAAVGNAYAVAQTYAWRGETDKAFEWLDKGFRAHDSGMPGLLKDRQMDALHKDPRWNALLKKMNLPE